MTVFPQVSMGFREGGSFSFSEGVSLWRVGGSGAEKAGSDWHPAGPGRPDTSPLPFADSSVRGCLPLLCPDFCFRKNCTPEMLPTKVSLEDQSPPCQLHDHRWAHHPSRHLPSWAWGPCRHREELVPAPGPRRISVLAEPLSLSYTLINITIYHQGGVIS